MKVNLNYRVNSNIFSFRADIISSMVIIGIDPGIGRVGWGIIREEKGTQAMLEYGCFETDSKLAEEKRLEAIHLFIKGLINKYHPAVVAVESLFFAANSKTAFSVGQARGVILLTVSQSGIPLVSYTPLQVKLSITGYGKADKNQVQQMVKSLLKLKQIPRPDDAADALAIAMTYAYSYKLNNKIL